MLVVAALGISSIADSSSVFAFAIRSSVRTTSSPVHHASTIAPLTPIPLVPFISPAVAGEGQWRPAGRLVDGHPAIYTTTLRLPDSPSIVAGVAWMNNHLLRARLYSGSLSPGGLFWKYTAPVSPAASRTLVAAFAGGFILKVSQGGYFSEGHLIAPLRVGAASFVIYKNGLATVGQWGRDVNMSSNVIAVRQNLRLLVDRAQPVPGLNPHDVSAWGASLYSIVDTPRSGLGITSTGALVYVSGPMNILDLARTLVRAGAVRAMVLDMNPLWPVFATYAPHPNNAPATPANGTDLLRTMEQTPGRFFEAAYARDFITMSVP